MRTLVIGDIHGCNDALLALVEAAVLALRPLYKPHRNGDAIRVAKLLGRMIKEKLCVRRMGNSGRLGWVFASADKYRDAIQILDEEPSVCLFSQ